MQPTPENFLQDSPVVSAPEETKPAAKQETDGKAPGVFESIYVAKTTAATTIGDNRLVETTSQPAQQPAETKQIITTQQAVAAPVPFQPANATAVQYLQLP